MTAVTATSAPHSAPPRTSAARVLAPPEERGRLTIAPSVIRGITEAASGEVDGVATGQRGWTTQKAKATVRLDGSTAAVRVRLAVRYPQSIPDVIDRLRAHIVERVHKLAGVNIRTCDINITELVTDPQEQRIG